MSLNFDLTAIPEDVRTIVADHDKPNPFYIAGKSKPENEFEYRKGDKLMSPVTNALIWTCMGVGLNGITEENLVEFATRCKILDGINGLPLTETLEDGSHKKRGFTTDELQAHIGLRTNVSTEKRAPWLKRMADSCERDVQYVLRMKREKAARDAQAQAAVEGGAAA